MNRSFIMVVTAFVCALCIGLYTYKKNSSQKQLYLYRCALIAPAEHPAMDEIMAGFTENLKKTVPAAECVIFNGQGNKTLLHSQIEKVVHDTFDVVFTIGITASQLTAELLKKRNNVHIKHIFTAVDDPVKKGLVQSLQKPGGQTTGVTFDSDAFLKEQIATLKKIKPTTKHILLVYDPAHPSNITDKALLAKICVENKIQFSDIAIMQTNELAQKVPLVIDTVDTILVLKDHLVVAGIDILVKMCSARNITLYCSVLNCGQRGAALAFGVYEYDYGKYAGLMAVDMLVHKKNSADIPVYDLKDHHLLINKRTSALQGIPLTDEQLATYKQEGVIVYE